MRGHCSYNNCIAMLLLSILLLLGGCATRAVQTAALPPEKQDRVQERFAAFALQKCPQTLDADLALEMRLLGKTEKANGLLQAQIPSFLRYTTLGPMDRALFIMVTDGSGFTMVDNRKAEAYTGSVDSSFWHKYFPENLQVKDVLPMLFGRLRPERVKVREIRGDMADPGLAWLFMEPAEGIVQEIRFDPAAGKILRHLVKDDSNDLLLDVTYDQYDDQLQCPQPTHMTVEGKSITGTIAIRFDRTFPDITLAPPTFQLNLPSHFTVKQVK